MASPIILLDACVLYPAPVRDLLLRLAQEDLLQARWSDRIHDEWIENLLRNRPELQRTSLERTRRMMNQEVLECLVTGYEHHIAALTLPDPNDRHVLAAAIEAKADIILTFNLNDFPAASLHPHGIKAQHPDNFILQLVEQFTDRTIATVKKLRGSLKKPPKSPNEYLATLNQCKLSETAEALIPYIGDI